MIQPNELRTGNILQYFIGEEDCEWEFTTIDWQDIRWAQEVNENFNLVHKPVFLTDELLEKCGFKCDRVDYTEYWNRIDGDGFHLDFFSLRRHDPAAYYSIGRKHDGYFEIYTQRDVKIWYLHQLQNLYFALTGEELEINLT